MMTMKNNLTFNVEVFLLVCHEITGDRPVLCLLKWASRWFSIPVKYAILFSAVVYDYFMSLFLLYFNRTGSSHFEKVLTLWQSIYFF